MPGLKCTGTGTTFLGDCFAECPAQFNVTGANVSDGGNCNFCNELINGHLFALFQFGAAGGFCNPPAAAPDTCSWSFFDGTFFSDDCLFADQFQLIFSVWGDLSINAWRIELSAIMARVGGDTQRITYSKTTTTPCVDITASFGPADICENVNDNLYCNMAAATWNVVSV